LGCGDKRPVFGCYLECGAHHRRAAPDNQSLLVKLLKFNFFCGIHRPGLLWPEMKTNSLFRLSRPLFQLFGYGQTKPNTPRALFLVVLTTFAATCMQALIRSLSQQIHPFQIAFFRSFFAFLSFTPLFVRYGTQPLRTKRLGGHAIRGLLQGGAILLGYMALKMTPLAKVASLKFTQPLFITVMAVLFLGEIIRARRVTALIVGIIGALIILRPGIIEVDAGALMILGAAAIMSVCHILIKTLTKTESSVTLTLYMTIFITPFTLIAAIPYWQTPNLTQLALMFLLGLIGNVAQISRKQAYRFADLSSLAPFDFVRLLWMALFGFVFFGEVPDVWTWVGGTVIFSSSTYIALRERQQRNAGKAS
jgi:drug/metabolite transporter (DMT)-like permease